MKRSILASIFFNRNVFFVHIPSFELNHVNIFERSIKCYEINVLNLSDLKFQQYNITHHCKIMMNSSLQQTDEMKGLYMRDIGDIMSSQCFFPEINKKKSLNLMSPHNNTCTWIVFLIIYIIVRKLFKSSLLIRAYIECIDVFYVSGYTYHTSATLLTFSQYLDMSVFYAYMKLIEGLDVLPKKNMENNLVVHAMNRMKEKYMYDENLFFDLIKCMEADVQESVSPSKGMIIGELLLPIFYSNIPFVKSCGGQLRSAFQMASVFCNMIDNEEILYTSLVSQARDLGFSLQLTCEKKHAEYIIRAHAEVIIERLPHSFRNIIKMMKSNIYENICMTFMSTVYMTYREVGLHACVRLVLLDVCARCLYLMYVNYQVLFIFIFGNVITSILYLSGITYIEVLVVSVFPIVCGSFSMSDIFDIIRVSFITFLYIIPWWTYMIHHNIYGIRKII